MTYADNIAKGSQEVNFLIKFSPRTAFVTESGDWTAVSGLSYAYATTAFTVGRPSTVYALRNNTYVTEVSKAVERASLDDFEDDRKPEWFFDDATGTLYIGGSHISSVTKKPNEGYLGGIYIEYELYLSTKTVSWHRNPTDTASSEKIWRGDILKTPSYQSSSNELFFGFLPTFSSSFEIKNESGFYNTHVYDNTDQTGASISKAPIDIWRCVGPLRAENVRLAFRGFINSFAAGHDRIHLSLYDYTSTFDREFNGFIGYQSESAPTARHGGFFGDQSIWYAAKRKVIGYCEKLTGRCNSVLFETETPTTSDNRQWTFGENLKSIGASSSNWDKSATISTASSGTVTLNGGQTTKGISVGDEVILNNATTASTVYAYVTGVSSDTVFTHDGTFSVTGGQTATVTRKRVCGFGIIREGKEYRAKMNSTNFNIVVDSSSIQILMNTAIETSLGGPFNSAPINPSTDTLWLRVKGAYDRYGSYSFPPSDHIAGTGSPLGTVHEDFQTETNPVQLIYEMLFSLGYVSDDDYNITSFTTAATNNDFDVAITTPIEWGRTTAESFREVIQKICLSAFLKLYINAEGKWEIKQVGPLGSPDITVYSSEILSYTYSVDYDDIVTNYTLRYARKDVNQVYDEDVDTHSTVNDSSGTSANKHVIEKSVRSDTYLIDSDQADTWLARYMTLLGSPIGVLSIQLPLSKIEVNLGDVVRVYFDNIIGDVFGSDTYRDFSVIKISYDIDTVRVDLFDQIGIEAEAAEWS